MLSSKKSRLRKVKIWEERGDAESARNLAKFIQGETDDELRADAVRALGSLRGPEILEPLIDALRDSVAEVRAAAASALGAAGAPQALPALLNALQDSNEAVRACAAHALGRIDDHRAIDALIGKLKDADWHVCCAAASALGAIGDERVVVPLLGWMEKVFISTAKKLTAAEKLGLARDVSIALFARLGEEQLQSLAANLMLQVNVKSWEVVNPDAYEYGWTTAACKNPIWKPLQDELELRKSERFSDFEGAETQRIEAGSISPEPEELEAVPEPTSEIEAADAKTEEKAEAAPPAPTPSQEGAPKVEGIVAEFLAFLKRHGLESIALVGGAPRDVALGRAPKNLDVTIRVDFPESFGPNLADPMDWNLQFADRAGPALEGLASALGFDLLELINGRATFTAGGQALPIQYVGPFILEEAKTKRAGLKIEQKISRTASRVALVANGAADRIVGLTQEATINRMWLDPDGAWRGGWRRAVDHLRERLVHVEAAEGAAGPVEIFRILAAKHALGFTLSEEAIDLLEGCGRRINDNLAGAVEEFSREAFDRAMGSVDLEEFVEQLELLGLIGFMMDVLDPAALMRINDLLSRREIERRKTMQEQERALGLAKLELEAKRAEFEARRMQFREHFDKLDESRSTKNELEQRLRREIDTLRQADEAARAAAQRLNEATKSFRSIASGEPLDPAIIREHREALADKREKDERVDGLRVEVEAIRSASRLKHNAMQELQDEMERLGKELERSAEQLQSAQARLEETAGSLDRVKSQFILTAELRREKLRGRPAAESAAPAA